VELAYGRKRALEIATTLALDPEMMLLDEPTAGMAHQDVDRVSALIKKAAGEPHRPDGGAQPVGGGAPVGPHYRAAAGEILAEGDYKTVSANPEVIQAYLGAAMLSAGACTSGTTDAARAGIRRAVRHSHIAFLRQVAGGLASSVREAEGVDHAAQLLALMRAVSVHRTLSGDWLPEMRASPSRRRRRAAMATSVSANSTRDWTAACARLRS